MNNSVYIRKLLQDISKIEEKSFKSVYDTLTHIIVSMESEYNLQEEEIIKQLELMLKSIS